MFVPPHMFDPTDSTRSDSSVFNSACALGDEICLKDVKLSVGSTAIDYESDPSNPIFNRMVLFGGRGWSIYELPDDPEDLLKLVFDSADTMEKDGCSGFPWSHNAIQDDEYAPVSGPNNTLFQYLEDEEDRQELINNNDPEIDGCLDRGDGLPGACPLSQTMDLESRKEGAAIANVIVGEACGRLVAAMATEKSSIAMLFDITDMTTPDLLKVFHLTPVSENKNIGLAYNDGELGEVDPETGLFLTAEESPSGKAGIMFAGAHSGTVSFWEFECKDSSSSNDKNGSESASSGVSMLTGTMKGFPIIFSSVALLSWEMLKN